MTRDLSNLFKASAESSYQVLDCTLRDGGYRNDWDFSFEFCQKLVNSMPSAQVRFVELGFRFLENNALLGPHAFTTDHYLDRFDLDPDSKYLVMINASDFASKGTEDRGRILEQLFPKHQEDSSVDGVRIATTLAHIDISRSLVSDLSVRGYFTMVNLMQASRVTHHDLIAFGELFESTGVAALYLADTFGSMMPEDVALSFEILKGVTSKRLGFHGHDNLGLALLNSLAAIQAGASIVDGTLLGMGRGAGNLRTEEILLHSKFTKEGLSADWSTLGGLLDLVSKDLAALKGSLGWGYSPEFVASGFLNVHPNYAQELQEKGEAAANSLSVLSAVSSAATASFSGDLLQNAMAISREFDQGQESPKFGDRIVLLGPGELTDGVLAAIRGPIVDAGYQLVALNDAHIKSDLPVAFRFIVNPASASKMNFRNTENGAVLVAPKPILEQISPPDGPLQLSAISLGFKLSDERFGLFSNVAHGKFPIALNYALAALLGGGTRVLALAGFPGYPDHDERMEQVATIIRDFANMSKGEVFSISKTRHQLPLKSPYGSLPK